MEGRGGERRRKKEAREGKVKEKRVGHPVGEEEEGRETGR